MGEMQILSKQINFINLMYYFNGESSPKDFISFTGQIAIYKKVKDGCITLEKAKEKQKEFK